MDNVSTILNKIMEDRKPGQELTAATLEACRKEEDADYDNAYDLRDITRTRYEHSTYEAEPYFGTVGWFKFSKGKGKKAVAARSDDDGAYECLSLKKVTKVVKDNGQVEFIEFPINVTVSLIPVLAFALNKIVEERDKRHESAKKNSSAAENM